MTTLIIETTDPTQTVELTLLDQAASALILENWNYEPKEGFTIPHVELAARQKNAIRAITIKEGGYNQYRAAEILEFVKAHELFTELNINPRIRIKKDEANNPDSQP